MSWIILTIIAVLFWSISNTLDKFIFSKFLLKPIIPLTILAFIGLTLSFFIYLIHGFSTLSLFNTILALICGILYTINILLYYFAVKIEEVSRVVPLYYLSLIFVLIFATIFLNEIFTLAKYLGIFLLLISAIIISSKNILEFKLSKAFWLMSVGSIALAANVVITKYLLNFADYWTVFSYIRIGVFISALPIFYPACKNLFQIFKENKPTIISLISISELSGLVGVLFIIKASAIGPVTLVSALSSTQPFFVLIIASILSIYFPKIIKEELGKFLVIKIIAIILMFIGVILIT